MEKMTLTYTPKTNWILLSLFGLMTIGVFIAALIFPAFRQTAYAPVRELLLPPPEPIQLPILYSTEKEAWLTEVIDDFETSGVMVDGHPIQIEVEKMGSWEINAAVLDGLEQPVLISPASSLQLAALQDASTLEFGKSLVNPADNVTCRSVVTTPLVLVAWEERASVLWGNQPGDSLWLDLHDSLIDPHGWAAYHQPDWGYIKFGHTDPLKSNSGFMTILLMTYGYYGKADQLSAADILSNEDFQTWFLGMEHSIGQFEHSTGPLMKKMVTYGPSTYDFVTVYEATALEQAENAQGKYGDLRVYYPPVLSWSDHPFCLVQGDWVSPMQIKAATLFIEYLTSVPAQESAMMTYGFRPVSPEVSLTQPGSPFDRYAANGFLADLSSIRKVEIPQGNVLNTLRDFWARNVSQ